MNEVKSKMDDTAALQESVKSLNNSVLLQPETLYK